jgi:site-specific recombinase XerD
MDETTGFVRSADLRALEPYAGFLGVCKSVHTQENYHQDLRILKHFLDDSHISGPCSASAMDLTRFAGSLAKIGITPAGKTRPAYSTRTLKRILASVRSFYRFLAATQLIASDPTAVFHNLPIRTPKRNPRPLSLSKRQALLSGLKYETLEELQISLTVRLGYECGLRVSEIAGLRVRDIQIPEFLLSVVGKGDKERTVPITPETRKWIQKYLDTRKADPKSGASPFLFCSPRHPLKPIHPHFLEVWVKVAAVWAAFEDAEELSVHVLRHTFGTCLAEAGASVYEIRDLMGHSSISVSESYVKMASQGARDAHKKAFGDGYRGYALNLASGPQGHILRAFRNLQDR